MERLHQCHLLNVLRHRPRRGVAHHRVGRAFQLGTTIGAPHFCLELFPVLILGFFVGNSIRKEEGVGFTNGHGVRRDGKGDLDLVRLCDFFFFFFF